MKVVGKIILLAQFVSAATALGGAIEAAFEDFDTTECEVQCGIDYFGRPQYWMAESDKDRCDIRDDGILNMNWGEFGCSANVNIFRNNGFDCVEDADCSRRSISRSPDELRARARARSQEFLRAAVKNTKVSANFEQGGGSCDLECGVDFAGRTQHWLSKRDDLDYCDVVKAFNDDDWDDLACSDDVDLYESFGYHCVKAEGCGAP